MMEILRCGVVGYGYMGEIRRAVIERSPRLRLVGICEPNADTRNRVIGCETFETANELLATGLDILFVCVPNALAPDLCIEAMRGDVHVFCEKPPGRTLEDIERIRAAETPAVKLMFGFNHRFHPSVQRAKVIVDSGRLGGIIGVRGVYGKSGGSGFRQSWRNDRTLSGGGILLDQGIHMLDLFRFFCGDFERVKCFTNDSYWNLAVEDNAYVILANDQGQNAFFHSSATLWKHTFQVHVLLEEGYLTVAGLLSRSGSYGRETLTVGKRQFEGETEAVGNPAEELTYFDRDDSWDLEVAEFVRCIDESVPVCISSSQDAWEVMKIIDSAYKDAGRPPENAS